MVRLHCAFSAKIVAVETCSVRQRVQLALQGVSTLEWRHSFHHRAPRQGFYTFIERLISQRTNNPMNKWTNELNRQFSKQEIQMANKHMKVSCWLGPVLELP
jgi:hypothetical protein